MWLTPSGKCSKSSLEIAESTFVAGDLSSLIRFIVLRDCLLYFFRTSGDGDREGWSSLPALLMDTTPSIRAKERTQGRWLFAKGGNIHWISGDTLRNLSSRLNREHSENNYFFCTASKQICKLSVPFAQNLESTSMFFRERRRRAHFLLVEATLCRPNGAPSGFIVRDMLRSADRYSLSFISFGFLFARKRFSSTNWGTGWQWFLWTSEFFSSSFLPLVKAIPRFKAH